MKISKIPKQLRLH